MYSIGIDLGTTNSLVSVYDKGRVVVLPNSSDMGRLVLPSVIAFKKDKTYVGMKAREILKSGGKDVFTAFKRKMGTTTVYNTENKSFTPINLSAIILKELKNFQQNYAASNYVITIPASFDSTQANATLEAAAEAGLKNVKLLQEPIAASLAYANETLTSEEFTDGKWVVYDLGGGTFDAALVSVSEGEMKILDHEGDNYLGGTDFDSLIIEKFIIPELESKYSFGSLKQSLCDRDGSLNHIYQKLQYYAEQAKIELSSNTDSCITIEGFFDDNGNEVFEEVTITRDDFETIIDEYIHSTTIMIRKMIERCGVTSQHIKFILFVGGSTYIPYVRKKLSHSLGIAENFTIDPTTAIAVGAAYYSASKRDKNVAFETKDIPATSPLIEVKCSYRESTKDSIEYFSAKFTGDISNKEYRILRNDGGFDSGRKVLKEKIMEELPLVQNLYNEFRIVIYNEEGNVVSTNLDKIGINCGYSIVGQPLPQDICLEVDDLSFPGMTKLEPIFKKNSILPLRKTIIKTLNKSIEVGEDDSFIRINVLEAENTFSPATANQIGFIEVRGSNVQRTILKGTDIELTISINESRELNVEILFLMTEEVFSFSFVSEFRSVEMKNLRNNTDTLIEKVESEIYKSEIMEYDEVSEELMSLLIKARKLQGEAFILSDNDNTDKRYQIETTLRNLDGLLFEITKKIIIYEAILDYLFAKEIAYESVSLYGEDADKVKFAAIQEKEKMIFASKDVTTISDVKKEYYRLNSSIRSKDHEWLIDVFESYTNIEVYKNKKAAQTEIYEGKNAIEKKDWRGLTTRINNLWSMYPKELLGEKKKIVGFSD